MGLDQPVVVDQSVVVVVDQYVVVVDQSGVVVDEAVDVVDDLIGVADDHLDVDDDHLDVDDEQPVGAPLEAVVAADFDDHVVVGDIHSLDTAVESHTGVVVDKDHHNLASYSLQDKADDTRIVGDPSYYDLDHILEEGIRIP